MANAVGETIRFFMERFGYSPEYLGKRAGVSRAAVYRHLSGEVVPVNQDRDAYATVFEMTPAAFATEVEKREAESQLRESIQEETRSWPDVKMRIEISAARDAGNVVRADMLKEILKTRKDRAATKDAASHSGDKGRVPRARGSGPDESNK